MNKLLEGVLAPVVTTFSPKTGELDFTGSAPTSARISPPGIHGIVVNGSTGEAALLERGGTKRADRRGARRAFLATGR